MPQGKVSDPIVPNRSLLRLVARAYELHGQLAAGPALAVSQLAAQESLSVTHIYKLLRLRWLAPDIVEAFLEGRQPAGLNATKLLLHKSSLPLAWADQRKHLGLS